MSPLWPEAALARAAWADAVARGLVDDRPAAGSAARQGSSATPSMKVRRVPRARLASIAL